MELALALKKFKSFQLKKRGDFEQKIFNVCNELADVKIMIAQADKIFNNYSELINERIDFKLKRLENMIREDIM